MIHVQRNNEDSSQKVVSSFLKRVRKFNLVARKRKTQFAPSKTSKLRKKRKALSRINFDEEQKLLEKIAKV